MNTNNIIWLIVVLVVLVGGYVFFSSADSTEERGEGTSKQEVRTQSGADMMDEEVMNTAEQVDDDMDTNENIMDVRMTKGTYEAYSPEKLVRANEGDVVLFFKASWCPSCRALESDIQKNIDSIPEGVTLLEINYDSAVDLKKKYGVTVQHTLVQVDADGNLINKWVNSPTLARVVSNIQ